MAWIEMAPFESSNLKSARYNPESSTLEVSFKNGTTYQYFDVPQHIRDGFDASESKGGYLAAQVKGHYRYSKL